MTTSEELRTVTIGRYRSGVTREAQYIQTATSRGAVVLLKWGALQILYRFSAKTGKGTGKARDWHILPEDLTRVQKWARE